MHLFTFLIAISFTVAALGFCAWAFARSFVYISHQTYRALLVSGDLLLALSNTAFGVVSDLTKVSASKNSAARESEPELVDRSPAQPPLTVEPGINWAVYDVPAYLRKGTAPVW